MNMHFLPGSENAFPETDDDDPDRGFYSNEIHKLHAKVEVRVTQSLEHNNSTYLCKRVGLISRLVTLVIQESITRKEYIELSQMLNIDIIEELSKRNLIHNDGW